MTLNGLCVLRSPPEKLNDNRPILSAAKPYSYILGVPRRGASNDSGVLDDDSFRLAFGGYFFGNFRET